MKRIFPALLALLVAFSFTGCASRTTESSSSSSAASEKPAQSASPSPDVSESPNDTSVMPETALGLSAFRDALREAYGDKYYPDTKLTEDEIRSELGMDDSLYEEVYAENTAQKALNGFFCKEKRISSIFREKSLDFFAPCHYNYLCYFVLSNKYKPLPDGGWEGYRWLKSESKTTNLWRAHSDALRSSAQERALFRKFARERLTKSLPLSARRSPKQLASASTNNQT